MPETITADVYDYPKYYDLIFGSDWKAEFDFLQACFKKHAKRPVKRVFEPACGTGRLLVKLGQAGYEIGGNDLNEKAIQFCNDRLERNGLSRATEVGDMSDFRVKKKFDAGFNMINSFRHLPTETAAENHLKCMADAIAKGGLYVLGLHLTPPGDDREGEEEWHAQRGSLSVISRLWTTGLDRKKRREYLNLSFDIRTPTKHFVLADRMQYRTYSQKQFEGLVARVPAWEVVETYDFCYDIDEPIEIDKETEDVVYILRKR